MSKSLENLKNSFEEIQEELLGAEMLAVYGGAHDDEACGANKNCELSCTKGCSQSCAQSVASGSTKNKKCELSCKKGCSLSSATSYN